MNICEDIHLHGSLHGTSHLEFTTFLDALKDLEKLILNHFGF